MAKNMCKYWLKVNPEWIKTNSCKNKIVKKKTTTQVITFLYKQVNVQVR